jgi:hypothetical protein
MSRSRNLADLLESTGDVKATHLDNTTSVTVTDNVTSTSTTEALSANQGKTLKDLVDGKQASDADLTTLATNGIGTSANQLVQLDGSAKLPAVDGSNLTGVDSLPSQTSQSGKFLTTNGSAASWGEAGGGAMELLGTVSVSGNPTYIEFSTQFSDSYDNYIIKCVDLRTSNTTNGSIWFQIKGATNGWITTDYYYTTQYRVFSSAGWQSGTQGQNYSYIDTGLDSYNGSDGVIEFEIKITNARSSGKLLPSFYYEGSGHFSNTGWRMAQGSGVNRKSSTEKMTGIRIYGSAGTWGGGKIILYGLKNT